MVYLIVSLLVLGIGINTYYAKTAKAWVLLWALLALFWGTSFIYAPDIPGYIYYFDHDTYDWFKTGIKMPDRNFEWGFNALSCLFRSISSHYYVFQFSLYAIESFLVWKGISKLFDERTAFLFACVLFFIFPTNLMSALRQGIPVSFFIFSLSYVRDRKIVPFFLMMIIGSFFHSSSIYLLFVYFIPRLTVILSKKQWLVSFLLILDLCYFLNVSLSNLLIQYFPTLLDLDVLDTDKYETYMTDEATGVESNFGLMKLLEMNVVYVLFILRNKTENKTLLLLQLLLLFFFTLNVFVGGILAHRISYYFTIPYQLCLIISFIRLGQLLFKDKLAGYMMVGLYTIFLYVFKFNDVLSGDYVYHSLILKDLIIPAI